MSNTYAQLCHSATRFTNFNFDDNIYNTRKYILQRIKNYHHYNSYHVLSYTIVTDSVQPQMDDLQPKIKKLLCPQSPRPTYSITKIALKKIINRIFKLLQNQFSHLKILFMYKYVFIHRPEYIFKSAYLLFIPKSLGEISKNRNFFLKSFEEV